MTKMDRYYNEANKIINEWRNDDNYTHNEQNNGIQQDTDELQSTVFNNLFETVNGGFDINLEKNLIDAWNRTHRTLQQNFFRQIIIPLIRHIAEQDEVYFDARNEDTKALCESIIKKCGNEFGLRRI